MAKPIVRKGKKKIAGGSKGAGRVETGSVQRKSAKKVARKQVAKKQPPKKVIARTAGTKRTGVGHPVDRGLVTAFHHMQRASIVMSLMQKGTGDDLHDLLQRGVSLYRKAIVADSRQQLVLRAIGVLRAAEHLSMAGLYAARDKHSQKVASPPPHWLENVIAETGHRLEQIEHEEPAKGPDLFAITVQLLRQAVESDYDAHLAFEFAMAADALCFALEHGL
jgi:hypothetical protein